MFWKRKSELNPDILIIGLGNPGAEYADTRHNVGFMTVDRLAQRYSVKLTNRRNKAVYGIGAVLSCIGCLAKPMTYMNASGEAVKQLSSKYGIPPERCLIILDDMSLPIGRIRIRSNGSSGGHNGLKSIERMLNTQEYPRIRIGIGPANEGEAVNHVLGKFHPSERKAIDEAINLALEAAECWLDDGIEIAMNRFNGKK